MWITRAWTYYHGEGTMVVRNWQEFESHMVDGPRLKQHGYSFYMHQTIQTSFVLYRRSSHNGSPFSITLKWA